MQVADLLYRVVDPGPNFQRRVNSSTQYVSDLRTHVQLIGEAERQGKSHSSSLNLRAIWCPDRDRGCEQPSAEKTKARLMSDWSKTRAYSVLDWTVLSAFLRGTAEGFVKDSIRELDKGALPFIFGRYRTIGETGMRSTPHVSSPIRTAVAQ